MKLFLLSVIILCSLFFNEIHAQEQTLSATPTKKKLLTAADYPEIIKKWQGTSFSSKNTFEENIVQSKDLSYYTKLFARPEVQKMIGTQKMVTIFVVPNTFFTKMDEEKRKSFMDEENSDATLKVLTSMMVPGRLDSKTLLYEIEKRGGKSLTLKTLSGEILEVYAKKGKLILKNEAGDTAFIGEADFSHANGFFHIAENLLVNFSEKK